MYKTYDKQEAVRNLQVYLSDISDNFIAPSGVYDERTRDAVIIFQEKYSIEPNGIVNKETYDIIYSEYQAKKIRDNAKNKTNVPIEIGSYGEEIYKVNEMMITVMDNIGAHHTLRPSAHYSEQSDIVQKELKNIFNLDNDLFDEFFYDSLKKEYEFITKGSE